MAQRDLLLAGECLFAFQHGELDDGSWLARVTSMEQAAPRQIAGPSRRSLVGGILHAEMGHHIRQLLTGLAKAGKKGKKGRGRR